MSNPSDMSLAELATAIKEESIFRNRFTAYLSEHEQADTNDIFRESDCHFADLMDAYIAAGGKLEATDG